MSTQMGVYMHVHVRQMCTHVQNCTIHVQAHKLVSAPGEGGEERGREKREERNEEVERREFSQRAGFTENAGQAEQAASQECFISDPPQASAPNNCQTLPFYTLGAVVSCRGLCPSPGAIMGGVQGHVQVQIQEHVQVQLQLVISTLEKHQVPHEIGPESLCLFQ